MIVDITLPLSDATPIWPGDPAVECLPALTIARDGVNVSALHLGTHSGTHIDAPLHLLPGGDSVDQIPLEQLAGPCSVLEFDNSTAISADDLQECSFGSRLILKTHNSRRYTALLNGETVAFDPDYVALTPDAAMVLVERGVRLVGIDALSVDPFGRHDLPAHRILLQAGMVIVEGLYLAAIEPGEWQMACLPLRLTGADGAPARAILWK